jgi:uncharacterized membrane protein (Fun14 family)
MNRTGGGGEGGTAARAAPMPRWKKVMFGVAGSLVAAGLVFSFVETGPSPGASADTRISDLSQGFVPGGPSSQPQDQAEPWSQGFFRLGFSWFAGFCIGFALRKFFSIVLFGCGVGFLMLFGLQQAEIVVVDWQAMDRSFQALAQRLQSDFSRFQTIVTGSLPAAGLGTLGLYAGVRRTRAG